MRPQLKDLEDQTVVITGASSGSGMATARLAAERGAQVVLAARSADGLREVADMIRADGGEVACVVADVADEREVRRIAEAARGRFGGFDTWVNNAGVSIAIFWMRSSRWIPSRSLGRYGGPPGRRDIR